MPWRGKADFEFVNILYINLSHHHKKRRRNSPSSASVLTLIPSTSNLKKKENTYVNKLFTKRKTGEKRKY